MPERTTSEKNPPRGCRQFQAYQLTHFNSFISILSLGRLTETGCAVIKHETCPLCATFSHASVSAVPNFLREHCCAFSSRRRSGWPTPSFAERLDPAKTRRSASAKGGNNCTGMVSRGIPSCPRCPPHFPARRKARIETIRKSSTETILRWSTLLLPRRCWPGRERRLARNRRSTGVGFREFRFWRAVCSWAHRSGMYRGDYAATPGAWLRSHYSHSLPR